MLRLLCSTPAIMNGEPLDHEAFLNSLDAIDRACEIARRQIQGLFYVVFRVPFVHNVCINVHQNQLRLQDLKRKRRRHFEKQTRE